jgi:DNA-binding LacI/PurR family transcriptional regulator
MASVRAIAERAGVSIATVSRALNHDASVSPKTRRQILSIANEFGYVGKMGKRVTTNIGLVYTGARSINSVFDSALLEGLSRGLDEYRFDIVLLNMQRDKQLDESYTQFFMRKGVRGVVLRTTSDSLDICRMIADEQFPHVVISERFEADNVNYIGCDSTSESARAVEYLISLGHRRIAFATHIIPDGDHRDRFEGYRQALTHHGIGIDERLVLKHRASLAGGATVLEVIARMANRPTAVFFADPLLAVGAMNKARQLRLDIPNDLSVIGVDDAEVRYSVYPTLTAVCQNAAQLGHGASQLLASILAEGSKSAEGCQKTLPCYFEVHQSTGPVSASAGQDAP